MQIANAAAIGFKSERGLPISFPLGAKMSALVQYRTMVCVSTMGASSALARYAFGDGYAAMRIESASETDVDLADGPDPGVSISAPIGYMTPTAKPSVDWKKVDIQRPGDFVALATFRFPRQGQGFEQIATALAHQNDPQRIAIRLAETHAPRTLDSLCGVLMREAP
jgi:hypothetical protein